MKEVSIKFNFTDDQFEEVQDEAESMDMSIGEMLTESMKFIIKDLINTRKNLKEKQEETMPLSRK
jgi:hypothetical protein